MKKRFFVLLVIMTTISTSIFSASPTMILGLGAGSLVFPYEEESLDSDWFLNTDALLSYRDTLTDTGYYSFFSSFSAGFAFAKPYLYSDEEMLSFETGFHFHNSKLICTGGLHSSITGTNLVLPFYCPEWEMAYYFITERKKVQPFLSYHGYYFFEPESKEDIFYEGLELGIKHRPVITAGYGISLGIGWENWPEYPVYSAPGAESDTIRNDLLCMLKGEIEGIFQFFLDWEIILSIAMRWSNTNDYIEEIDYINERSEDRVVIKVETNLEWSPSRYIHIKLHPYFTPGIYINKQAVTADGSLKGEYVRVYEAGGNFHIDWTPDNSLYILFETEGMIYSSNYMDQLNWYTLFHLGIKYSLKF
ncbi:MAG: hypothetical protein JXB88_18495 [Spirochaetales bacterium]|nr:hypothetical protein [Spirochaetales bacterium]